jgi:hypothetical protein
MEWACALIGHNSVLGDLWVFDQMGVGMGANLHMWV